jgi:heme-degrading monooxygenase HmoA
MAKKVKEEEKKAVLSVFVRENGKIELGVESEGFNTIELLGLKTLFEEAYSNLIDSSDE